MIDTHTCYESVIEFIFRKCTEHGILFDQLCRDAKNHLRLEDNAPIFQVSNLSLHRCRASGENRRNPTFEAIIRSGILFNLSFDIICTLLTRIIYEKRLLKCSHFLKPRIVESQLIFEKPFFSITSLTKIHSFLTKYQHFECCEWRCPNIDELGDLFIELIRSRKFLLPLDEHVCQHTSMMQTGQSILGHPQCAIMYNTFAAISLLLDNACLDYRFIDKKQIDLISQKLEEIAFKMNKVMLRLSE